MDLLHNSDEELVEKIKTLLNFGGTFRLVLIEDLQRALSYIKICRSCAKDFCAYRNRSRTFCSILCKDAYHRKKYQENKQRESSKT